MKDALLVVLTSPQFLFLIENSSTPAPEPLDNYELASKLSYFLWNGPPDRKTLQLAASGTLRKQLDAEVERMIADPRFSRFADEFASQWLSLDKFQVLEAGPQAFPKLTRDTRAQLKQEPVEFVQYLMRNNLPVRNLISVRFRGGERSRRQLLRPGRQDRERLPVRGDPARPAASWAACSRRRRSWPGCPTAANRTR